MRDRISMPTKTMTIYQELGGTSVSSWPFCDGGFTEDCVVACQREMGLAEFEGTDKLSPYVDSEHPFHRGGHVFAVAL